MNIYTEPGRKVTFIGKNGYEWQRAEANKLLEIQQPYTVKYIEVHSCTSYVEFEELPGKKFNTVMFEDLRLA